MSKTDEQLRRDIEEELRWDPKTTHAKIDVSVYHGVVSLSGAIDTYAQKGAAASAVKRVSGVRDVTYDLRVKILADHLRDDADIAAAVLSALRWDVFVPQTITARVEQGSVTLEGHATWNFQRLSAERAIRQLTGVVAVHDDITLTPNASAEQVEERVAAALLRQAIRDTNSIHVDTWGGKVTLTGHASSFLAVEDAVNAAWAAPGVTEVVNQVRLSPAEAAP